MESMDQWWNQGERVTAHWPARPLTQQADLAETIAAIIDVIEAKKPLYRTIRPQSAKDMVMQEQQELWMQRCWDLDQATISDSCFANIAVI